MQYKDIKITKGDKGTVIITGELPTDIVESYRAHALMHLNERIEVPGFRKGKVPENVLEKHVSELAVLEEMAEHALGEHYPKLLEEHKIDAIGRPEISITKLAKGNPLGFTITTAVFPEITLPDYKTIAKKEGAQLVESTVTDEEVEKTIKDIRGSRSPKKQDAEGKPIEPTEEEMPPLDDDFVKSLGNFENVDDFKKKLRDNIKLEKDNHAREANRLKILEKVLENTKAEIPDILVEAELDKMLFRMKSDISQMGLSYEDYLKHMGKSEDAVRDEFRADAEKRVRMELLLHEIAKKENIKADPEKVSHEVAHIMEMYKDADKMRSTAYVEAMLENEAVFKFLESQAN